jgi:hypothetical protein
MTEQTDSRDDDSESLEWLETTEAEDAEHDDSIREHLSDVGDGSGCTEVWERLSERRASEE